MASNTVRVTDFGLQEGTTNSVYVMWRAYGPNTDHYEIHWHYQTEDKTWFLGSDTTTTNCQDIYDAPDIAIAVKVTILPVAVTRTDKDGNEYVAFTADWSSYKVYEFKNNPPEVPPVPSVKIEKYKLTAEIENLQEIAEHADTIEFYVVRDNATTHAGGKCKIVTHYASFSCNVTAGHMYKVCARAWKGKVSSDWSEYSSNINTVPSAPASIIECRATSKTSVFLTWSDVPNATSFDIEYATKLEYFDRTDQTTVVSGAEYNYYELIGLESGYEYFFRVRSVNDEGSSTWTSVKSVIVGKNPTAPTTYSSTTTVVVGEPLSLYWIHNSEDASSQTYAELELTVNGITDIITIKNSEDEEEKDKTSVYSVNTSQYSEGAVIKWRVRTMGVTGEYGDWSILRQVDVYAPATITMNVTNSYGQYLYDLTSFPFYVRCDAGPYTQTPTGYYISITADQSYETVDAIGNFKMVTKGEQIYSQYFDSTSDLDVTFSANNLDLANNMSYTVTATVSMNSGLTATSSWSFDVAWSEDEYIPNAEISIDKDIWAAYIRPYITTEEGEEDYNPDVLLSVYRREYDGNFIELMTDIENGKGTFIVDPHPALDYARYRVIAKSKTTGAVSYYDIPNIAVKGIAIIIQWDEQWETFMNPLEQDDQEVVEPNWSGTMLMLPYNIDVSDKYNPDATMVKYIGRKHPVAYYGTQIGETSSWSVDVPKSDKETLYMLRRLANWMGDVYVREPSGSGYHANVKIDFSQKHCEVVVPVSIDVTRVEGGM